MQFGSARTVVVPRGTISRASSPGGSIVYSMCRWLSMNVGITYDPAASKISGASNRPGGVTAAM